MRNQHNRHSLIIAALLLLSSAVVCVGQNASVRIKVKPDQAYIFVDGKPIGHEGSRKLSLPVGPHTIGVYNYGFVPQSREVTVNAGENQALEFNLERVTPEVGGPFGRIQIEGAAHAAVLLNGKEPGYFVGNGDEFNNEISWSQKLVVPPGTYQVTVLRKDKELWSGPVTVEANQRVIVHVDRNGEQTVKPWSAGDQGKTQPRFTASTATALVTVAPVSGKLAAEPAQINCADSSRLTWTTAETVNRAIVAGSESMKQSEANGNVLVTPHQTTTYHLQGSGPGGLVDAPATVNVNTAVESSLAAQPAEIRYRRIGDKVIEQGTSNLNWSASNASTAALEPLGTVTVNGNQTVKAEPKQTGNGPVDEVQTYTLTAKNVCGGVDTHTATVHVVGSIEPIPEVPLVSIFFPTGYPEKRHPQVGLVWSQQQALSRAADGFKKYLEYDPNATFKLAGNTDVRSSHRYNQALSERRAKLVKDYLVSLGIPAEKIETIGLGKTKQLDAGAVKALQAENPNKTAKPHGNFRELVLAYNRRVDITLLPKDVASTQYFPANAPDAVVMWDGTMLGRNRVQKATKGGEMAVGK